MQPDAPWTRRSAHRRRARPHQGGGRRQGLHRRCRRRWRPISSRSAAFIAARRGSSCGPRTTAEVAEVVRLCAAARMPIYPQGGNTGLCGGAVPDEDGRGIVLSLGRMNRVRALDAGQLHDHRRGRRHPRRRAARRRRGRPPLSLEPRRRGHAARSAAISRPMPAASRCCATATCAS